MRISIPLFVTANSLELLNYEGSTTWYYTR
jgi:hypothetical protein